MGLNNIAKEGWDYISSLAKNISVEGLRNGWNTYIKQSPEELANVARATMQRKNTILSNLDLNEFDKIYSAADKSNADYIEQFNKLRGALNSGNTDEAKSIATTISERFQDGAYLKLLQNAENVTNSIAQQIEKIPSDVINTRFKKDFKIPEKAKRFVTDEQEEKIANMAYRLQGKKQYFNTGDAKTNQIRAGVAAGTYMGAMTTARLVHGGSLTINEYGVRDIVGIPFI
jgi:hypothetical protein